MEGFANSQRASATASSGTWLVTQQHVYGAAPSPEAERQDAVLVLLPLNLFASSQATEGMGLVLQAGLLADSNHRRVIRVTYHCAALSSCVFSSERRP